LRHRFQVLELGERISRHILESDFQGRLDLLRRMNVHFAVIGTVRKRALTVGPAFVLDLTGVVRHAELQEEIKGELRKEFASSFQPRWVIGELDGLLGLEFAALHADVVARFIIGLAAAVSGDLEYAQGLLADADRRCGELAARETSSVLATLRSRIRVRLGDLLDIRAVQALQEFLGASDPEKLSEAGRLISSRRTMPGDSYRCRLAAAQCAFWSGDLVGARAELKRCGTDDDAAWLYGLAFLAAYEGDLQEAYNLYRKAFEAPLGDPTTPIQCESFIQSVLEKEPERYWLAYCLGLINHRAKGDLVSAERDFALFLDSAEPTRFQRQIGAVQQWLAGIRSLSQTGARAS
jgi:hypothetical protein